MGAGGGNWGAGVNASTGGMASILQQNAAQNQGLNVTQQDIANQQAQELLTQEQAKTPAIQAQQALATNTAQQQLGVDQTGGVALKQATQQEALAKSLSQMTTEQRTTRETQDKGIEDAYQMSQTQGFDWKNPGHVDLLKERLDKSGIKLPDDLTDDQLFNKLATGHQLAQNSLEVSRQLAVHAAGVAGQLQVQAPKLAQDYKTAQLESETKYGVAKIMAGVTPGGALTMLQHEAGTAGLGNMSDAHLVQLYGQLQASRDVGLVGDKALLASKASLNANSDDLAEATDPDKIKTLLKQRTMLWKVV